MAAKRMTGSNGHFASSINQALEQIAVLRADAPTMDVPAPAIADSALDLEVSVVS
jgi:hypothetical protein